MAMTTERKDGVLFFEQLNYFIPVIQTAVQRVMIEEDHRLPFGNSREFFLQPVDGIAWHVAIAHTYVRAGSATQKFNTVKAKVKIIAAKDLFKILSPTFAPTGIMVAGNDIIRYVEAVEDLPGQQQLAPGAQLSN